MPQFHFHVIGRRRDDPYWPGVVWGRSVQGRQYADADVEESRALVLSALAGA